MNQMEDGNHGGDGGNGGNVLLDAIKVDEEEDAMEKQKQNYSDPRSPSKHISANSGMGWDAMLPDAPDHEVKAKREVKKKKKKKSKPQGGGMVMLMREKKPKHRKQDDEEEEEEEEDGAEESFEESSLEEVENDDAVKVKVADAEEA